MPSLGLVFGRDFVMPHPVVVDLVEENIHTVRTLPPGLARHDAFPLTTRMELHPSVLVAPTQGYRVTSEWEMD